MLNFEKSQGVTTQASDAKCVRDPLPGILTELRAARLQMQAASVLHGFAIEALDKAYAREKAAQDALYAILA